MSNDGNYSFYQHNLKLPTLQKHSNISSASTNLPYRKIIVASQQSSEKDAEDSPESTHPSPRATKSLEHAKFTPHPPSYPHAPGSSISDHNLAGIGKGKKRNHNNSPRNGSDDEREMGRKHVYRGRPSLPPINRSSSLTSLDESPRVSRHIEAPAELDSEVVVPLKHSRSGPALLEPLKPEAVSTPDNKVNQKPKNSRRKEKKNKIVPLIPKEEDDDQNNTTAAKESTDTLTWPDVPEELDHSLTRREFEKIALNSPLYKNVDNVFKPSGTEGTSTGEKRAEDKMETGSDSSSYTSVSSASTDSSFSDSSDEEAGLRQDVNKELTKNLHDTDEPLYESIRSQRNKTGELNYVNVCTVQTKPDNGSSSDSMFNVTPRNDKTSSSDNHYDVPESDLRYDSVADESYQQGPGDNSRLKEGDTGIYESIRIPADEGQSSFNNTTWSEADSELSFASPSQMSGSSSSSLMPKISAQAARERRRIYNVEEFERYFPDHTIRLYIATWNMHGEKDVPYIDELLLPPDAEFLQDIYVLGTQESTTSRREWEIKIQETLGPSHVLLFSNNFGVLHLVIYIRRELLWFCTSVQQASVSTRPGHMFKTKGALGVCFKVFGTSFLFMVSHFTSHEGKVKDRIADYSTIIKSLELPQDLEEAGDDVTNRFDRVFWLGDFNFRVDMERKQVDKLLQEYQQQSNPDYKDLLEKDELLNTMRKGDVFRGFREAAVKFYPSYKLDICSDEYDTSSKMRVPSWTDRILYKSEKEDAIKCVLYSSCDSVKSSDHRPVYGVYEAAIQPSKPGPFTGGQYMRDVYIEANKRRHLPPKHQDQSSVCTIL